ncbi:MAG: response regulator [Opitutaceae bacterium]|nr:response regulator [Cytophagales bacterium]
MNKPFNKVLLVDDELICNYISIKWVKRLDIAEEVHVVTNGKLALDFIKANFIGEKDECCPDLILLDIKMPVMDGIEFLQEFQNTDLACKDKIKIVLLTSSKNVEDIQKVYKFNIHGYLEKPLNREKIEEVLLKIT